MDFVLAHGIMLQTQNFSGILSRTTLAATTQNQPLSKRRQTEVVDSGITEGSIGHLNWMIEVFILERERPNSVWCNNDLPKWRICFEPGLSLFFAATLAEVFWGSKPMSFDFFFHLRTRWWHQCGPQLLVQMSYLHQMLRVQVKIFPHSFSLSFHFSPYAYKKWVLALFGFSMKAHQLMPSCPRICCCCLF